jgi:hypothetical protein
MMAILWLSLFLVFATADTGNNNLVYDNISPLSVANFIETATNYLTRISHSTERDPFNEGVFTYISYLDEELQLDFTEKQQETYNLLRHNGAIYSLGLSYDRIPNESVLSVMRLAVGYLKKFGIKPVPDTQGISSSDKGKKVVGTPDLPILLAAWETTTNTEKSIIQKAKLGGAGLSLVALVSLEKISPGSTELSYMRQIANFIKFMQRSDGSFTCRYIPEEGGRDDSWVSLYYPGEAALGLIYLSSIETDVSLKAKWISYLESIRRNQVLSKIQPDHWALIATQHLLPILDKSSNEYWLVYDHGVRVVRSILDDASKQLYRASEKGYVPKSNPTCPISARLEGLIASLSFVRDSEMFVSEFEDTAINLKVRIRSYIRTNIQFLLESQEKDNSHNMRGAVPYSFPLNDHRSMEVRVDYVQHAMSAMIALERLLHIETHSRKLEVKRQKVVSKHTSIDYYFFTTFGFVALLGIVVFSSQSAPRKGRKGA